MCIRDRHYIILRASKEETLKRAVERSKLDRKTNSELVETMWEQFCNLGIYESNVVDTTNYSIQETAVSYTHLDVYKRQVVRKGTLHASIRACGRSSPFGRIRPMACTLLRKAAWPVSYTHLDVYKRQERSLCC